MILNNKYFKKLKYEHLYRKLINNKQELIDAVKTFEQEHNCLKPLLVLGGKTPDEANHQPERSLLLENKISAGRKERRLNNTTMYCHKCEQTNS